MAGLKSKKVLLAFSIGLIIILILVIYFFYPRKQPEAKSGRESVKFSLQEIELVQGTEGEKTWQLQADKCLYFKDREFFQCRSPRINLYLSKGKEKIFIQAPQGSFAQEKNQAQLWPAVEARYKNFFLQAQKMLYLVDKEEVLFKDDVLLQGEDITINSNQAEFNLDKEIITFSGRAEVVFYGKLDMQSLP